jgi:hypothetical protein
MDVSYPATCDECGGLIASAAKAREYWSCKYGICPAGCNPDLADDADGNPVPACGPECPGADDCCVVVLVLHADREACKRRVVAKAILDVGGDFADDFVTGRRVLTDENTYQVAGEIESYWREP